MINTIHKVAAATRNYMERSVGLYGRKNTMKYGKECGSIWKKEYNEIWKGVWVYMEERIQLNTFYSCK